MKVAIFLIGIQIFCLSLIQVSGEKKLSHQISGEKLWEMCGDAYSSCMKVLLDSYQETLKKENPVRGYEILSMMKKLQYFKQRLVQQENKLEQPEIFIDQQEDNKNEEISSEERQKRRTFFVGKRSVDKIKQ